MFVFAHVKQSVDALAFSPDGSTLATGGTSEKAGVTLWNLATQSRVEQPSPVPAAVYRLWWTGRPTKLLIVSTRGYGVYAVRPPSEVVNVIPHALIAGAGPADRAWFTDRGLLTSPFLTQSRIDVAGRLRTGWRAPLTPRGWASEVLEMAGGGQLLAMEYEPEPENYVGKYRLRVRSAKTGEELATLDYARRDVSRLAATDSLFCVASGTAVRVWAAAKDFPHRADLRNDGRLHFTAVAFHPSGRYLAATSNDATVKLYDTANWQLAKTFTWDIGKMRSVAFSPDGTLAAAGSDTGKVVVWDLDI